jgi:hypothetical protein
MKNLQSYLGNFDFYLGKSSELPAEPLSADEPSQVASTGSGSLFHVGSNALAGTSLGTPIWIRYLRKYCKLVTSSVAPMVVTYYLGD